jgi:hypothetical protein
MQNTAPLPQFKIVDVISTTDYTTNQASATNRERERESRRGGGEREREKRRARVMQSLLHLSNDTLCVVLGNRVGSVLLDRRERGHRQTWIQGGIECFCRHYSPAWQIPPLLEEREGERWRALVSLLEEA